tara:strand:+ start:248 stop:715 length:468 start_codon:yes stop_codon:yes gene_type:complete
MKAKIKLGGNNYEKGHSIIDMELKETAKGLCFSASGLHDYQYCRYKKDWDYQGAGQCIDAIAKDYPKNNDVKIILKLWKKHHLNDMNPGTPKQTKYLESLGKYKSYEWACEELEKANLLYDNEMLGYRYGSAWLYKEIPDQDIKIIKQLINKYNS